MDNFLKQDEKQDIKEYDITKKVFIKENSEIKDLPQISSLNCTSNIQEDTNIQKRKPLDIDDIINIMQAFRQQQSQSKNGFDPDKMKVEYKGQIIEIKDELSGYQDLLNMQNTVDHEEDLSPRSYFVYPEMVIRDNFTVRDAIKQCENDIKIVNEAKKLFLINYNKTSIDIKKNIQQQELIINLTNAIYDYYNKFKNFTGPILLLEEFCFTVDQIGSPYRILVAKYLEELQKYEKFLDKYFIVCFLLAEQECRSFDQDYTFMNFNTLLKYTGINLTNIDKQKYLEQLEKEFQHTTLKYK